MFDLLFPKWWSTLKKLIWLKAAALSSAVVKTVTAAIVHIKDALAGPAQNVTIAIEPVQSGSGDPSPDNVRPITGWTGANVTHTGKNLFNKNSYSKVSGAYISGGKIIGGSDARIVVYIPCKPNTTYTLQKIRQVASDRFTCGWTEVLPAANVSVYGETGAPVSGTVGTKSSITITTGATAKYLVCWLSWGTTTPTVFDPEVASFQIELGSTATDYEPYTGTTIPISFPTPPGTVYGGTLDVTTGVLTVTHVSVDMGTLTRWAVNESYAHRLFALPYLGNTRDRKNGTPIICSMYPVAPGPWGITSFGNNGPDNSIAYHNTDAGVWVRDDSFTTLEEFLTAVSGQTIVYELATPQTYQLTAHQIDLLLGENNLWSDTGKTTLTYLADGRASDTEALNILLGGAYRNSGAADEATDKEALDILLGGTR